MENNLPEENLIKEQLQASPPQKKSFFSKKVILISAGFGVVLIAFLIVTLSQIIPAGNRIDNSKNPLTKSKKVLGSILLSPATVIGTPNKKTPVDIIVNTGGDPISGVVVGIKYNPLTVSNVTLSQAKDDTSPLSYALQQIGQTQYDTTDGWAMLTLQLPKEIVSLNGVGKVATLSFVTKPINVAISSTNISISQLTGFLYPDKAEFTGITKNQLIVNYSK